MKKSVVALVIHGTFSNSGVGTSDLACTDLEPAGVSGVIVEELVVISEKNQIKVTNLC